MSLTIWRSAPNLRSAKPIRRIFAAPSASNCTLSTVLSLEFHHAASRWRLVSSHQVNVAIPANQRPAFLGLTSIPRTVAETYEGQWRRDSRRAQEPFENRCHWREARRGRQISTPQGLVILGARGDAESGALVGAPARPHWGVATLRPPEVAGHMASRHRTPYRSCRPG
jgi:hypothetical protein